MRINKEKVMVKIRVNMSCDLNVMVTKNPKPGELNEEIAQLARTYVACLGDKDIKIEGVEIV